MKKLKQFIIPFSGLTEGSHEFTFKVDKSFFEYFENSDIQEANIVLRLLFIKRSTMLELEFNFTGTIKAECDRCLSSVELPIESTEKVFIKFGDENYDESEEILVLSYGDPEVDISKLVYEMVAVALPMKKVHKQGNCVKEIEEQISIEEDDNNNEIDPRWEQLKNL